MMTPEEKQHLEDVANKVDALALQITEHILDEAKRDTSVTASIDELKAHMATNTDITAEIRDLVKGFKLVGKLSKWFIAIAAGSTTVAASWHSAVNGIKDVLK